MTVRWIEPAANQAMCICGHIHQMKPLYSDRKDGPFTYVIRDECSITIPLTPPQPPIVCGCRMFVVPTTVAMPGPEFDALHKPHGK